jgi:hypothetical protein
MMRIAEDSSAGAPISGILMTTYQRKSRCMIVAMICLAALNLIGCKEPTYSVESAAAQPAPRPVQLVPVAFAIVGAKGGFGGEWYGKIDLVDFEAFMQGQIANRLLTFHEVYYIDEQGAKIANADSTDRQGRSLGYSNTVAIRSDGIFRMMAAFTIHDENGVKKIIYNSGIYDIDRK